MSANAPTGPGTDTANPVVPDPAAPDPVDTAAQAHALVDRRAAARHLLAHPLTCAEHHPDAFALIRRHEHDLDRWFTQRLGYRLHVTADTARLYKSTVVPHHRPLRTASDNPRPFTSQEYLHLALILAAVAAGPRVISLRDLVHEVRSAAADAGLTLSEEPSDRRALVTALYWMIDQGLARELHERVERYATDEHADAVIEVSPDRVALVPLPALGRAETAADLVRRDERVGAARQWMRARLVEDPVLYADDLTGDEWREIRRRLGGEAELLYEMFGLVLESRAEGMAAIDPTSELTDVRFPTTGTVGHAALLTAARLAERGDEAVPVSEVVDIVAELAAEHRRHWSKEADQPPRLTRHVLRLLAQHRIVELDGGPTSPTEPDTMVWVRPLAHRFTVAATSPSGDPGDPGGPDTPTPTEPAAAQEQLW